MNAISSLGEKAARRYQTRQARRLPMCVASSAEDVPPHGQAALWHQDVIQQMPRSARLVGLQLARLCEDDSKVTIPWRSLADAVGVQDKSGRHIAFTQRGVQVLVAGGWLRVETRGKGRAASTTFYLMPGERPAAANGEESELFADAA